MYEVFNIHVHHTIILCTLFSFAHIHTYRIAHNDGTLLKSQSTARVCLCISLPLTISTGTCSTFTDPIANFWWFIKQCTLFNVFMDWIRYFIHARTYTICGDIVRARHFLLALLNSKLWLFSFLYLHCLFFREKNWCEHFVF